MQPFLIEMRIYVILGNIDLSSSIKKIRQDFAYPSSKTNLVDEEIYSLSSGESESFYSTEKLQAWLKRRVNALVDDLFLLNEMRSELGVFTFYKIANSLKGHHVVDTPLVNSEDSARSFLVPPHKYVVEPSEKCMGGGGIARSVEFRESLPILFHAFKRVKAYRNIHCHLEVNSYTEQDYRGFLKEDFNGESIQDADDGWFDSAPRRGVGSRERR